MHHTVRPAIDQPLRTAHPSNKSSGGYSRRVKTGPTAGEPASRSPTRWLILLCVCPARTGMKTHRNRVRTGFRAGRDGSRIRVNGLSIWGGCRRVRAHWPGARATYRIGSDMHARIGADRTRARSDPCCRTDRSHVRTHRSHIRSARTRPALRKTDARQHAHQHSEENYLFHTVVLLFLFRFPEAASALWHYHVSLLVWLQCPTEVTTDSGRVDCVEWAKRGNKENARVG